MPRATAERLFHHSIERVFERYTDHVGWGEWAGFGIIFLEREGVAVRDGVGAVRAFKSVPGLLEEVTLFEAPERMEYRVTRGGFPLTDHHGVVAFSREGPGTRVSWQVTFRSRIPGTGWLLSKALSALFRRVLASLSRDLERPPS